MKKLHRFLFCLICRLVRILLSIRYKIEIIGLQNIVALQQKKTGVLFLPNHPAEVDPIMMMAFLGPKFFPRGVVIEHFYEGRWLRKIMDFCRALPVPSLEAGQGVWRRKQIEKVMDTICKGMDLGENFLIYPAGELKRRSEERLGGASFVYDLCRKKQDITVCLVRTVGLWGSSFSTFQTGRTPPLGKTLKKAFITTLQGFFFFVPKRNVSIEFCLCQDLPRDKEKGTFNRFLETWYNAKPDPLVRVPYGIWKKLQPVEKLQEKEEDVDIDPVLQTEVIAYLAALSKVDPQTIGLQSHLSFDLGLDSLDIAEICAFLDKRYGINAPHPETLKRVKDVCLMVMGGQKTEKKQEEKWVEDWFEKKERRPLCFGDKQVIHELFLQNCARMKGSIAAADRMSGVFSYRKMKTAALVLAEELRFLPGEKVGVMLPSSVAGYLIILALLIAGKIPVMLNWTAGRNGLNHACQAGGFEISLSSKKFLDRITLEDFGAVEDTLLFLEDIRKKITLFKKMQAFFRSFFPLNALQKTFSWNQDPFKMAVLLFTSGTEALPKAVPLSHHNILSNQKSAFPRAKLTKKDSLYGALPPFHSFGFSLTGLFPLLCGLKVFYAPDPTDSYQIVADVEKGKLTVLCLAPSFLRSCFFAAEPKQLESLCLIISGAEKPLPEVPLFVKKHLPQADWIEGYGITECSPIVSLQVRGAINAGVGPVLQGLEICFIDHEDRILKKGEQGEICICGPGVFAGYLNSSADPFINLLGKKWYKSGDLGYLDEQGNLHIVDRLKRTVKIGGEMVSLSALEQAIYKIFSVEDPQSAPCFAVVGKVAEKQELVLFVTQHVELEQVNGILREKGFPRIVKISQIILVDQIPLTGTGKIHYRKLEEMIVST